MSLSIQQRKYLRGLAHSLHPLVTVADKGVSPGILKELASTISHHELVKVRLTAPDRATKATWLAQLLTQSGAELVQQIGHVATLYKRNSDAPKIALPK
jgi:RNA-binding protein